MYQKIFLALSFVILTVVGAGEISRPATAQTFNLKEYQKQFLDPQADNGENVILPTPHDHSKMSASAAAAPPPLADNVGGRWEYLPPFPTTFNAIHTIAGPGGKVLLVAGSGNNKANFDAGSFTSYLWDTNTNTRQLITTPEDLFCAGHTLLPDGRALVGGGTTSYGAFKGETALYAFNFNTAAYERLTPLEVGRWYPTAVNMPDGRTLFAGGLDANGMNTPVHEIFDYRTNSHTKLTMQRRFPLYPRLHLAANGKLFMAGPGSATGFWDPVGGTPFQPVAPPSNPDQRKGMASCFFGDVRNQNLMAIGGGWPGTTSTSIVNLSAAAPAFREGPPLKAGKGYVGCVNLPDGTLFEANGGSQNAIAAASTEAAILKTLQGPWTSMNPLPAGEHRLYHSQLFLLDNGKVVSITSNPSGARSGSLLAYSPTYLFTGTQPVITGAPTQVAYGGNYAVTTSAPVGRVTITSASSPTHSLDANQRYVSLPVTNGRFTVPTNRNILPPGWYRLWAVDTVGRPSVANWIRIQ